VHLFPHTFPTTPRESDACPESSSCKVAQTVSGGVRIGIDPEEEWRVTRDLLLENLRWLAEGNPKYAGTDEEGQQNLMVAHLLADDFLLSYIDDQEVTEVFNRIRKGYSS
jgi:hypothetical protein